MKNKKEQKINGFAIKLIEEWERNFGVNFAIALTRLTGWMLHVDWLINKEETKKVLLRAYLETNQNIIFDFTGKKNFRPFHTHIIEPLARKYHFPGSYGISSRCHSELKLNKLLPNGMINEGMIEKATIALNHHPTFLSLIPARTNPEIPAHLAVKFAHGQCVPFANAFNDIYGIQAVGINVSKYKDYCQSELGFCHALILHSDGEVEDAWGKRKLCDVIEYFHIEEYTMSVDIYETNKAIQSSLNKDLYTKSYNLATKLLKGNYDEFEEHDEG